MNLNENTKGQSGGSTTKLTSIMKKPSGADSNNKQVTHMKEGGGIGQSRINQKRVTIVHSSSPIKKGLLDISGSASKNNGGNLLLKK